MTLFSNDQEKCRKDGICAAVCPRGIIDFQDDDSFPKPVENAEKPATCWAGFFMIAAKAWKPLRDQLNLADGHALTTALMVGYPKYEYARLPEREKPFVAWW